jgi:methyl-accepting chemotaxis protein
VVLVGEGASLAEGAEHAVDSAAKKIAEVASMVSEMSSALHEQRTASELIARQVHHIANMGEQNNIASVNTTRAIESLNELSLDMQNIVSRFQI